MNVSDLRDDTGKLPAYAWPGGYAVAYLMDDGEFLCAACMNDDSNPTHDGGAADGWRVEAFVTDDWHDSEDAWTCAHCNATISEGS